MKWRSPLAALVGGAAIMSACGVAAPSYACSDRLGCVETAPDESIRIGTLLTLTTPDSPYGIDALRGVEIAVAQKGPILGHDIELIKEDDESKVPVGIRKADKLIESDKVDMLTGPVHSGVLAGIRDKVHNSKSILIVSNAGADEISRARWGWT